MSWRRLEFRIALGILLVWSAWPTVAGALDTSDGRGAREVAAPRPVPVSTVPTTVVPATTVAVPPSTAVTEPPPPPPSDPPTTAAPATTPPTPATAPPAVSPPAPAPEELAVAADAVPSVCDASVVDIVNAMNGDRAANGLGALCTNARLTTIAQAWADHLAQTASFEHQDLWGVVATTPFRALAENLLRGPPSIAVDQMEAAWMASPGHRLNILGADYLAAGVGIAHGPDGRIYVVVEFGGLVR